MKVKEYNSTYNSNTLPSLQSHDINKILNLPDLLFYTFCNETYSINRGIYNTIDQWFYERGLVNIYKRRTFLLSFLSFINESKLNQNQHNMVKFGPGGLTKELEGFFLNSAGQPEI
ncbi:hypothetical protein WAX74_09920 [Psychrobacillus sp. FJAT-51614]|uniref:Uncharacterized protein n=1 Tax=Psychrobacillus mangrovi TaxID=3117745 RepID=A0ABU8F5C0_9BACI